MTQLSVVRRISAVLFSSGMVQYWAGLSESNAGKSVCSSPHCLQMNEDVKKTPPWTKVGTQRNLGKFETPPFLGFDSSLVFENRKEYYQAINLSNRAAESTAFIEFMLQMISETLKAMSPQVSPQVRALLKCLKKGEMGRGEIQGLLGLTDRKSFRLRYLKPALESGLIEMTLPDRPNSRQQKYRLTKKGSLSI